MIPSLDRLINLKTSSQSYNPSVLTGADLKKFERLNQSPVNQRCLKALKEVGEYPWPEALYCLQLAKWAFESGKVKEARFPSFRLQANLDNLFLWEPSEAMRVFEEDECGDQVDPLYYAGESNDPVDLSRSLLLILQSYLIKFQ